MAGKCSISCGDRKQICGSFCLVCIVQKIRSCNILLSEILFVYAHANPQLRNLGRRIYRRQESCLYILVTRS